MATTLPNGVLPIVDARARAALAPDAKPLFGLEAAALAELAVQFGEKPFRARQLEQALYRDWDASLDDISTLPRGFREALQSAGFSVGLPEITETFRSVDGTERYLIAGLDGQTVETVWMPNEDEGREEDEPVPPETEERVPHVPLPKQETRRVSHVSRPGSPASGLGSLGWLRRGIPDPDTRGTSQPQRRATICVSSQIGCAVNCQFCLTAQLGIVRNLTAGEIAGQVVAVLKRQKVHLGRDRINLVFMGMGEPFLNYDAWIAAFRLLSGPIGLHASRMTVSTSGIVPGILRFAAEPTRPRLALSLNASNNAVRAEVMPITRKWNIQTVLQAVRQIPLAPREKITFEYVLLGGVNDRPEHADEVVSLVKTAGFPAYVNLIVWNPGPGTPYAQPDPQGVDAFQKRIMAGGVPAFVRRPRGRDIYAACGQLKRTTS